MKEQRFIDIDHLVVDEENPRFEAVSTEDDALFSILMDQSVASGNKVLNLARDIADNGLNASELLVVSPIEGTDSYRVREGNRRVTAIKLSLHSDLVPEDFNDLIPRFEELAESMRQNRLINCYVCDDEDEIRRLLVLRHGGESGGIGTVKWNSVQTSRFSQVGNQQTARALSMIEHLREQYGQGDLWSAAVGIPATNLGRLISTPEVRQVLNIIANGNDARYLGGHDDLLLDVLGRVKAGGVGQIYSKDARVRLVEEAVQRVEPDGPRQAQLPLNKTLINERDGTAFVAFDELEAHQKSRKMAIKNAYDANAVSSENMPLSKSEEGAIPESIPVDSCEPHDSAPDERVENNANVIGTVRRKPVSRIANKRMFGHKLRPKGVGSNDVYRGIEWIDNQYLKNPDGLWHLLPILGFSLRLLMENVAREYYASIGEDRGDKSLANFLKEIAKPAVKQKLDAVGRNNMALASDWIDGTFNFEAFFSKWAHGTLAVDRSALVRQSELVALIIIEIWT